MGSSEIDNRKAISNGKWQNSNGLQFVNFSNPEPFAICTLPFAI
jgi:hypothetical protein